MFRCTRTALFVAATLLTANGQALGTEPTQGEAAWKLLAESGSVAVIRHARTSGGAGDPTGMTLDDCSTQRNLTSDGRAQATSLGEQFRTRGVAVASVLSSRWCRCLETARLAFNQAESWAPLDNVYGRREREPAQNAEVRKRIATWKGPGTLVLVSHGVNITPLTGVYPGEGEVVVLRPDPVKDFQVVGRIATGG
jgi:phosphohistidine phosphatase SixA